MIKKKRLSENLSDSPKKGDESVRPEETAYGESGEKPRAETPVHTPDARDTVEAERGEVRAVGVNAALEKVAEAINDLNELFLKKVTDNEAQRVMFIDLKDRVERYEKDALFSITRPYIFDIMSLRDAHIEYCAHHPAESPEEKDARRAATRRFDLVLEKYSVYAFSNPGAFYNPDTQKALVSRHAETAQDNGRIYRRLSEGYYRLVNSGAARQIIRPEHVEILVYKGEGR